MDIQNKEFERSFRGYDIEDVDEFLDRIAKDIEQLTRENTELKDQINHLQEKNKNYQKLEETMHNAIVVAQETADEVKNSAKREADLIKREAESEAKRIVDEARSRSDKILSDQEDLFKQAQVFKMRFRTFMESQLATLESEDWLEGTKKDFMAGQAQSAPGPKTDFEPSPLFEPKPLFESRPEPEGEKEEEPEYEPVLDFDTDVEVKPEPDYDLDSDPEF
jgi:cell division initiation protein